MRRGSPDHLQTITDLFTGDKLANLITHAQDQVQNLGQDQGPIAFDGSSSTNEDTILSGAVSAIALNGDAVTYALAGNAPAGLTFNPDGTFNFDPTTVFNHLAAGEQATTSFQYTASDGQTSSNTATETITIAGLNDAPVVVPLAGTANEDGPSFNQDPAGRRQ